MAAAARIAQVLDFASARAPELQALHELAQHAQMQTPADTKLAAQRNQRRRRANAFKSHRMPQRLRQKRVPQQQQQEELIALPQRGSGGGFGSANAAATASLTDKDSAAANAVDDKQRCRKHERRPHLLATQRTWQTVRAIAASKSSNAEDNKCTAAAAVPAVWMATHVWHSKRMKMVEKYGMVLPAHRTDKSVSAALQAVRSSATLHDMSYTGVLELYGRPQQILEALTLVSDPSGSDFHGMRFLAGTDEGASVLYHEGRFPTGAIAPVTFMWRPLQRDARNDTTGAFTLHADWQDTKRQLWLWVHPAAFMEAAAAVASACQSVAETSDGDAIQVLDRRGHVCRFKLRGARADALLATVCDDDESLLSAAVSSLDDSLDEASDHDDGFDASATVQQCAQTNAALLRTRLTATKLKTQSAKSVVEKTTSSLYTVAVSDPRRRYSHAPAAQVSAISSSNSNALSLMREPTPTELALVDEIRCPLSLAPLTHEGQTAEEPASELILERLSAILRWTTAPSAAVSKSKSKSDTAAGMYPFASPTPLLATLPRTTDSTMSDDKDVVMHSESSDSSVHALVPSSFLWSQTKREALCSAFEKDHVVNESRFQARQSRVRDASASTVTAATPSLSTSLLHLIAVEKTGPFRATSGWDVIVAPSFAPVLLKALVFAGALVVGMDEDEALATVLEQPSFPRDFPDTQVSVSYWQTEADARAAEHARKPKAKRFAFDKHGVASPFQPNWALLFSDDDVTSAAADTAIDTGADATGDVESDDDDSSICVLRGDAYMQPFCFFKQRTDAAPAPSSRVEKIPVAVPTLVRVVVRVPGRGTVEANAMMFAPTADDVACFYAQKGWRGRDVTDSKAPERTLMGFVTSAVYDRPKGAFRATGFCACEPLQDVFLHQLQLRSLGTTHEALVMLRTPRAKLYRPVLLRAEA